MKWTCAALDFDNTLAHHKDNYEGLFDIFVRRGVPEEMVKAAYEKVKKRGFSIELLTDELGTGDEHIFNLKSVRKEFSEWWSSSLVLYPDVASFISRLQEELRAPIAIITQGHPDHQREKIELSGIAHDRLFVTSSTGKKVEALRELLELYGQPILYVDDLAAELDALRRDGLTPDEVNTVWLARPTGRHKDKKPEFEHRKVESLNELFS